MDSVGEGEGGKIWENGNETCKISCRKRKKKKKKVILSTQVSLLELKKIQYSNINSCKVQQGKEGKKERNGRRRERGRAKG